MKLLVRYQLPADRSLIIADNRLFKRSRLALEALVDNTLWQFNPDGSVSPGPVPGWPTTTGWDTTTGFGSPIAGPLMADLAAQP